MFEYLIEKPQMIAVFLSLPFCLWFLYLYLFADNVFKASSGLLALYWLLYVVIFINGSFDPLSYLDSIYYVICIDGVFAILILFYRYTDKNAARHAGILCFVILCHTVISLHLTSSHEYVKLLTVFFYNLYNELVILTMLLQIMVSKNGINSASIGSHGFSQKLLSWFSISISNFLFFVRGLQKEKGKK